MLNYYFWKSEKGVSYEQLSEYLQLKFFLFKHEICISSLTRKKHVRTYSFSFFSSVSLTFSFLSCFCCSIFLSYFIFPVYIRLNVALSVFLSSICPSRIFKCISPLFSIYISVPFHFVYVAFFLFLFLSLSLSLFHSPFLPPSPIKDHPRGRGDAFNSNQNSLEKKEKRYSTERERKRNKKEEGDVCHSVLIDP